LMRINAIVEKIAARARIERVLHMRYVGAFFGAGHRHEGLHHLDLLEQGRTRVCLDGASYVLDAGQALFVRAGRRHSSREPTPMPVFEVYSVSFRLPDLPAWPPVMPVVFREETLEVFQRMIREFSGARPGRDAALRLYLAELFLWLWRGRHATPGTGGAALGARRKSDAGNEKMKQAVDYIHANYMRKISARDIAAAIHVSVSFLSHNFRRETGLSLNAYLVRYRLEKALWLLDKTDHKTAAIAEMTGFTSSHYFYRAFKKHYKMSPRQYLSHAE
jgi:AraC-like DNA-binding protein